MTHTNDHDFQQFRGAFDNSMKPEAAFRAKMEKLLQSEKPAEQERTPTVLASPPKASSTTVVPARRSHPLLVAAAVLTVFAVVVASVWVLSGDVLEGEYASAPSGIATLPADVPLAPGADVYLEADLVAGTEDAGQLHGIFDGIAIYQTRSEDVIPEGLFRESGAEATPEPFGLDRSLVAVDTESGERLWERQNIQFESLLLSGDILIGSQFHISRFGEVRDYTLTGFYLHSGEELWTINVPDAADHTLNTSGFPILMTDSLIVLPTSDGAIRAWNAQTGEPVWESDFDTGPGQKIEFMQGEVSTTTLNMKSFAASVWEETIVIVNDDYRIQVLNSENGDTIASYKVTDSLDADFRFSSASLLQLLPMNSHIVLLGNTPGGDGQQKSVAVAFDPLTGEIRWTQQFDGGIGSPSVSDNGTIALNSNIWHQNGWFLQLLGQHGYSTQQFLWYDGQTGEEILHTERTRSNVFSFAVTNGEHACIRTEISEVVCLDRAGTRHNINIELSGHMIFEDNVLYIPTEEGLMSVQLP